MKNLGDHGERWRDLDLKSKRVWLGIMAGIIMNLMIAWLLPGQRAFIGVLVALYIGQVFGAKRGALVGAIVLVPISTIFFWQTEAQPVYDFARFHVGAVLGALGVILFITALGALSGAACSLAFRKWKNLRLPY